MKVWELVTSLVEICHRTSVKWLTMFFILMSFSVKYSIYTVGCNNITEVSVQYPIWSFYILIRGIVVTKVSWCHCVHMRFQTLCVPGTPVNLQLSRVEASGSYTDFWTLYIHHPLRSARLYRFSSRAKAAGPTPSSGEVEPSEKSLCHYGRSSEF